MIDLFCIASGPSLTAADCELIRKTGVKTVAVNNSWEVAPFCNYIYAGDHKWWAEYHDKITIRAERWACSRKAANEFCLNYHYAAGPYNSGMRAIQWGIISGFKKIALLGYDCSVENGLHWHGPHPESSLRNPNEKKIKKWQAQFSNVVVWAEQNGVDIVNCSRDTKLTCFPRMTLESAIACDSIAIAIEDAKQRGCDLGGHWM